MVVQVELHFCTGGMVCTIEKEHGTIKAGHRSVRTHASIGVQCDVFDTYGCARTTYCRRDLRCSVVRHTRFSSTHDTRDSGVAKRYERDDDTLPSGENKNLTSSSSARGTTKRVKFINCCSDCNPRDGFLYTTAFYCFRHDEGQ